ncbi:MAG: hypothetical protein ACQESU_07570 [Halobacteriota archaeon]
MIKNKQGLKTLLIAMLLVSMLTISTVSATAESKETAAPSTFEQGIIDLLNSNSKDSSVDDIIANYCKENNEQIEISKIDTSKKPVLRTYELKDGSDITFTDQYFFFITSTTEENQSISATKSISTKSTLQYTDQIIASQSFYNYIGTRLFTIKAEGYYGYQVYPATVETHFTSSSYSLGTPTIFQVTDWDEGGINYLNTHTGEIYASGHFSWGFEYKGIQVNFYDKFIKVYSTCDQFGNIHRQYIME